MRLHEDKKLYTEAVRATAELKGIPVIYIEKDYWVTLALKTIFTHPDCEDAIFKGGTALSNDLLAYPQKDYFELINIMF